MKKRFLAMICLCIGLMCLLAGCGSKEHKFDVQATEGYDGTVKNEAYAPFTFTIKNDGADFTGSVQMIMPYGDRNENVMYEKDISIGAGATKTVAITAKVNSPTMKYNLRIVDAKGNVLWSDKMKYKTYNSLDRVNVGVLSDDFGALSYIDGIAIFDNSKDVLTTHIMELKATDFPDDWRTLDMVDVILISNFSTDQLTDEQIRTLNYWIRNGGLLVVGTGSTSAKTLAKLNGSIINIDAGDVREVTSSFNLAETNSELDNMASSFGGYYSVDELVSKFNPTEAEYQSVLSLYKNLQQAMKDGDLKVNIREISSKDSECLEDKVLAGNDYFVMGLNKTVEGGVIYVSAMDFTQNPLPGSAFGSCMFHRIIMNTIGNQLIVEKMNYNANSSYQYYYGNSDNFDSVYNAISSGSVPSVLLYGVIILAYIIAIPVIYVIFRKKKKPIRLWIALPISAVLFTVIIYVSGFSTRIINPRINVATVEKQNGNIRNSESAVSVILPNARDYTVGISSQYDMEPYIEDNFWYGYGNDNIDYDHYSLGIRTTAEGREYEMRNTAAMASKRFKMESSQIVNDSVDVEVRYLSYTLSGTVENNRDCDLHDCFLILDNKLYKIGDLKAGEKFDLANAVYLSSNNYSYYYDMNNLSGDVLSGGKSQIASVLFGSTGPDYYKYCAKKGLFSYSVECARQINYSSGYGVMNGIFAGYPDEEYEPLQAGTNIAESRVTLYMDEFQASLTENNYQSKLMTAAVDGIMGVNEDTYYLSYSTMYVEGVDKPVMEFENTDPMEVEFNIGNNASVIGFLKEYGQDYYGYTDYRYDGELYLYNYDTNQYDDVSMICDSYTDGMMTIDLNAHPQYVSSSLMSMDMKIKVQYVPYWEYMTEPLLYVFEEAN